MDKNERKQQRPEQRAAAALHAALTAYAKHAKLADPDAVAQDVLRPWLDEHNALTRDPDEAARLALDGCRASGDGGYVATAYLLAAAVFCHAALAAEQVGDEQLAWTYAVDCNTYAVSLSAEFTKVDEAQSYLKARAARARHGAGVQRKAAAVRAYLGGEYGESRNKAAKQIAKTYSVEPETARRWLQGVPNPPVAQAPDRKG